MPATVLVQDLKKSYAQVQALRGVTFEINEGEILGLLGPNGAGKTTTLECLIGLRRPDSGTINLCDIDALAHPNRTRQFTGAQLQSTAPQPKITPRESLALFASFYDNPAPVDELIDRFQLREKQHATFDTLSTGQRQRLAVALAFVNRPKLLFLDEPTAGLDPQSRRDLHDSIRRMRDENRTILLTTHYIEEAHDLCDRVAVIDHGQIISLATPAELISRSKRASLLRFHVDRAINIENLRALPGVSDINWSTDRGSLRTSTVGPTLLELMKFLNAQNVQVIDLELHKPTLEDVFIELTGSTLRD